MACEVTSLGVQVHGGMGFIEETGAAQYYRDARILPIYEGTNGIQAADLAFRKILRDSGAAAKNYIGDMQKQIPANRKDAFAAPIQALLKATDFIVKAGSEKKMDLVAASSAPYLKAFGIIAGGALLARVAEQAGGESDRDFAAQKEKTSSFYATNILPLAEGNLRAATEGSYSI